jgi:hypothetical protein
VCLEPNNGSRRPSIYIVRKTWGLFILASDLSRWGG